MEKKLKNSTNPVQWNFLNALVLDLKHKQRHSKLKLILALRKTKVKVHGVSFTLWELITLFLIKSKADLLKTRALALAFSMLSASFPFVLFLFTLIPYIPVEHLQENILTFIKTILPQNYYEIISETLEDIISRKNSSIMSLGFMASLFFASNGVLAITRAFNNAMRIKEKRNFLKLRAIAFSVVLMTSILFMIGSVSIVLGEFVVNYIYYHYQFLTQGHFIAIKLITLLLVFFNSATSIAIAYKFLPFQKLALPFYNIGVWLASFLILVSLTIISFYLDSFANLNKLYGSIGALIVCMILISYSCTFFLLGFEFNVIINHKKTN
jgi:membrane protein